MVDYTGSGECSFPLAQIQNDAIVGSVVVSQPSNVPGMVLLTWDFELAVGEVLDIWRSVVNDLSTATEVAQTRDTHFLDGPLDIGTYYYWTRRAFPGASFYGNWDYTEYAGQAITVINQTIAANQVSAVGLYITNSASLPNQSITISWQRLTITDQNGNPMTFLNAGNIFADITVIGAGGLEAGESEAPSTLYFVYAIGKPDGTLSGYLCTEYPPNSLPSGYTYWGWLGVVFNNASSNFLPFQQCGKKFYFVPSINVLNAGSQTNYTKITLPPLIPNGPAGISEVILNISFQGTGNAYTFNLSIDGSTDFFATLQKTYGWGGGQYTLPVLIANSSSIWYKVSNALANLYIDVIGFRLP